MINKVHRDRLNLLYPDFKNRVERILAAVQRDTGHVLFPTETLRTFERQQKLYEVGRVLRNGVWVVADKFKRETLTNAQPGMSFHAYGLAADLAWHGGDPYLEYLQPRDEAQRLWIAYGKAAKAEGCVWGGDWNGDGKIQPEDFDRPHCQISYGLAVSELFALHQKGGLAAVWKELDLRRA